MQRWPRVQPFQATCLHLLLHSVSRWHTTKKVMLQDVITAAKDKSTIYLYPEAMAYANRVKLNAIAQHVGIDNAIRFRSGNVLLNRILLRVQEARQAAEVAMKTLGDTPVVEDTITVVMLYHIMHVCCNSLVM